MIRSATGTSRPTATANPIPMIPARGPTAAMAVFTPTSRPAASTNGLPEYQGLTGDSLPGRQGSRARPDSGPAVECADGSGGHRSGRPSGDPTANAASPTRMSAERPRTSSGGPAPLTTRRTAIADPAPAPTTPAQSLRPADSTIPTSLLRPPRARW